MQKRLNKNLVRIQCITPGLHIQQGWERKVVAWTGQKSVLVA